MLDASYSELIEYIFCALMVSIFSTVGDVALSVCPAVL
jgi:hypothetical protein